MQPARPTGFSLPGLVRESGSIAIIDDGGGIAGILAEMLGKLGAATRVVQDPPEADDCYGVVYLGGLREVRDAREAMALNRDAFAWARAMGKRIAGARGIFVTVQDTGGVFGLSGESGVRVWAAGLPALAKTARLEWPGCSVKAIDVERAGLEAGEIALRIFEELTAGGPEIEVGLPCAGSRITLVDAAAFGDEENRRPADRPPLEALAGAVLVVSGGARGVTAACLKALASEVRLKLVLVGRTSLRPESPTTRGARSAAELTQLLFSERKARGGPLSPKELSSSVRSILARREITETIEALQSKGSQVKYLDVDVQDGAELGRRLAEIRSEWGPIGGIIHAAGIIADRPIVEKSIDQFDDVFRAKVEGLHTLLEATASDPLRLLCLFSSVAARAGNPGQSDYAMANEVLNRVARLEASRRDSCRVKSIAWGAWDGGMVTPELRRRFEGHGVPLIPIELGARRFIEELSLPEPEVVVIPRETSARLSAQGPGSRLMEIRCDAGSLPCLADHAIAGVPVVPVAFVVDWILRAARACRPELAPASIEELQVVKGIRLERFSEAACRLRLELSGIDQGATAEGEQLEAVVRSHEGTLHYKAIVRMVAREKSPEAAGLDELFEGSMPDALASLRKALDAADREPGGPATGGATYDPYEEDLFHGPAFRAITGVDRVDGSAAVVRLKRREEVARMSARNSEDTAWAILLDAGLQAARLWGIRRIGKKTLPMSVARVIAAEPIAAERCVVIGRSATEMRTVTDVYLISDSRRTAAALLGLEMYVVSGEGGR